MLDGVRGLEPEIPTETFDIIARVLQARSGFCLQGYKEKCVQRRINIRINATGSPSPQAYGALLTKSSAEQQELLRVLTIHVSHFFRNPSTFEKLASELLPGLLQGGRSKPLRMLSVGCAAGEEPYSLALMLRERFPDQVASGRVSLRGIDVDAGTLEAAREGLYHPDRLAEVPPELKGRWFNPHGERFRLSDEIRSMVSFEQADLNDQGVLQQEELILCRNVLIYFERERQEEILNRFADTLGSGGVLVLGKAESLSGSARRRFRTVCPVERIYRVK
jgi:chemotaxis protein methyltransferase CheR